MEVLNLCDGLGPVVFFELGNKILCGNFDLFLFLQQLDLAFPFLVQQFVLSRLFDAVFDTRIKAHFVSGFSSSDEDFTLNKYVLVHELLDLREESFALLF
jgi:hypothetical protein